MPVPADGFPERSDALERAAFPASIILGGVQKSGSPMAKLMGFSMVEAKANILRMVERGTLLLISDRFFIQKSPLY